MESTPGGWDEGKSKTLTEDGDKNERERDREKRNQNRAFVRKGPVVRYIFPVTESSSVQNTFLKFWRNNDLSFSKYAPTNILMDRMSNLWCHVCTYIRLISIRSYFYQWLRSLQRKHVHISSRPPCRDFLSCLHACISRTKGTYSPNFETIVSYNDIYPVIKIYTFQASESNRCFTF